MFEEDAMAPILMDGSESQPKTLTEAVGQALGAASVCWENPGGAGIFDSTRAKQIADELLDGIRTNQWPDE